jgi:tetratricopeptide (TPR) repeat protein
VTGEQRLWDLLNDKLETLRASNRLPEAIRVAESALELSRRAFADNPSMQAVSHEKLGQLLDQVGDRAAAKPYLLSAHELLEQVKPPDPHALYRSARRLAFSCDNLGQTEEAIRYYEKAIAAGSEMEDMPYSDLGTMLNNIALIFRKSGRQKSAEPYYLHALQIYENHLGAEHADVASVLNNLGVFYTN